MHPIIFALFNGLGNIYNAVHQNHRLLELIIFILLYFVFKDVVKLGLFAHKKGWFKKSLYDTKAYKKLGIKL